MKIKKIKIDDIIPYKNNPRVNDCAVDTVAESIKNFGMKQHIVIDKDNIVVVGHTRLKACKKLGYKELDCIIADDLSDEKIKAYRIADNKTNELSSWDMELLASELEKLGNEFTGFSEEEVNELLNEVEEKEPEEDNFDVDKNVNNIDKAKTKRGNIYKLGNHRLMCGDSTNKNDVDKLLDRNRIDMVLTDPPYGISIVNDKTDKIGSEKLAKNKKYSKVIGDETTDTAKYFYKLTKNISKKIMLWGGNYFVNFLEFSDSWIIWDKRGDMKSNNFSDGEMCWCNFKTRVRIYKQIWNGMIREGKREERVHPTQKPIKLLSDILNDFTERENNIYDGFGGSGSTLIACEQTNRNCYMMELDETYCDIIVKRWEEYTGQKSKLII